ncbi:histidine phosphatase family protein [Iamia sp.]|uniref:histidine phosphatase family protein n=1 Tax=Iamia sp. TaxID=2722710 RepID=UPI002CBDEBE2|nr:histidine phosphatase family protein [Iamia sp.]HXH59703.1 histidine phosphatase family protein [Iamia sp.]
MELLLIRHALPVRLETSGGPADPRLSATGRTQAEALARHWAGRVDAVWTSPLRRARETATPLLDRLGLSATVDDDRAELDRGAAAYIPIEELRTDPVRGDEAVASWTGPDGEALRTEFGSASWLRWTGSFWPTPAGGSPSSATAGSTTRWPRR